MYVLLIIEEISMCGKKGLKFKKSEQSDFSDEIKTHLFNWNIICKMEIYYVYIIDYWRDIYVW